MRRGLLQFNRTNAANGLTRSPGHSQDEDMRTMAGSTGCVREE
jgi:hypothetical protein